MIPMIEPVLFQDPQAARTVCFCRRCGGECYHSAELCSLCEELP